MERGSASPKYQFYQIVGWAINMYGGSAGVYLNLWSLCFYFPAFCHFLYLFYVDWIYAPCRVRISKPQPNHQYLFLWDWVTNQIQKNSFCKGSEISAIRVEEPNFDDHHFNSWHTHADWSSARSTNEAGWLSDLDVTCWSDWKCRYSRFTQQISHVRSSFVLRIMPIRSPRRTHIHSLCAATRGAAHLYIRPGETSDLQSRRCELMSLKSQSLRTGPMHYWTGLLLAVACPESGRLIKRPATAKGDLSSDAALRPQNYV
jgi:hypothetical protein